MIKRPRLPSTSAFNSSLYSELIGKPNLINSIKNGRKGKQRRKLRILRYRSCSFFVLSLSCPNFPSTNTKRYTSLEENLKSIFTARKSQKNVARCVGEPKNEIYWDCLETDMSITEDKKEPFDRHVSKKIVSPSVAEKNKQRHNVCQYLAIIL